MLAEALEARQLLAAAPLRIEVGSSTSYTDAAGQVWSSDRGFSGGTASTGVFDVANTADDKLYSTRRWGNFSYSLSVPNGTYRVRLHFADPLYTTAGKRKFDVFAEGKQLLNDFDVAANGGGRAAIVKTFNVNIQDHGQPVRYRIIWIRPLEKEQQEG